jgi:hypothetical protein
MQESEFKIMAEQRNARLFLMADKENVTYPPFRIPEDPRYIKRLVQLDKDTVDGAEFYSEAKWIVPGHDGDMKMCESHTHEFAEFIGFFGFNYDDIRDLGAEIEFTVDNRTYNITESFAAFIPEGVQHGPLIIRNVRYPVFCFTGGDTNEYK